MNLTPRLLLVSPHAHYTSHFWTNTLALMQALQRHGHESRTVVFSTGSDLIHESQRHLVTPVFRRPPPFWTRLSTGKWQYRRSVRVMFMLETILCLAKALRLSRRDDRIVLHFIGGSLWPLALALPRLPRVRIVYSLFGSLLPERSLPAAPRSLSNRRLEDALRRALATGRMDLVCETEFVRDNTAPLAGDHIHLVPYAIDDEEELPDRAEARRRLALPPDEKIILFFGTHRQEKDYRTALKGCLLLPQPPLALFAGKTISANDPRVVVDECRYPKSMIIDEFVSEEMAKVYFAAADAVALPYEAGFSRGSGVLIECCRHLRPMIASATPYFSAFVGRYGCGEVYTPEDGCSFAETAGRLLANTGAYGAALERARHEHSWAVLTDRYLDLYHRRASAPAHTPA